MEVDKAEQLRKQWEDIESKNVEKLTTLLLNVEKVKKRTATPLFKGQAAVGQFINNHPLGFVVLFGGLITAGTLGVAAGYMVEPQLQLMSAMGGVIGVLGAFPVGVSCMSTAEKYKETTKSAVHSELFQLLPKLASNLTPQLNACIQQLYYLGADEKIPGPFWKQCLTLLRQIENSASQFQVQQKHVEQQLEKMAERDPQSDQAFESLKSFAQRHQNFVEVKVQSPNEDVKESVEVKTTPNAVKI